MAGPWRPSSSSVTYGLRGVLASGLQAVVALGVEAVAAQFGEAGAGPDVGGDAEVLVQQFGRGDRFAQDGAAAEQLHAQFALLRLAGVLAAGTCP